MRISVTSQDGLGDFHFESGGPWRLFKETISQLGHNVVPLEDSPDAIVFNNYSKSIMKKYGRNLPKSGRCLIAWEPKSNLPGMFKSQNLELFKHRFFPSPIWAERYSGQSFDWPQGGRRKDAAQSDWFSRIDRWCMVQGNRWSFNEGERYSLRREILSIWSNRIDLYGFDWNISFLKDFSKACKSVLSSGISTRFNYLGALKLGFHYQNYKGEVEDKIKKMSEYRYVLVIENSSEYLSEKLIDVVLAGSVPLYIGVDLEKFGIPSEIAFTCEATPKYIEDGMNTIQSNSTLCSRILKAGAQFVDSSRFTEIENKRVLRKLAHSVVVALETK